MAVYTKSGGRQHLRSSSIAIISVCGVVGGAWSMFRLMAPHKRTVFTEVDAFEGGSFDQTNVGNRTARSPRFGTPKPHAHLDDIKREAQREAKREAEAKKH